MGYHEDIENKLVELIRRLDDLRIQLESEKAIDKRLTALKGFEMGRKSDEEIEAQKKKKVAQGRFEQYQKEIEAQIRIEEEGRKGKVQIKPAETSRTQQRQKSEEERQAVIKERRARLEKLYEQHGGREEYYRSVQIRSGDKAKSEKDMK